MSHSTVLVALDPQEIDAAGGLEAAVAVQMTPFDEGGTWFKDGSRWDWYVIGGRYTGRLSGYDPDEDPRNWKRCDYCGGTGKRIDMVVKDGCNSCHGTGTARNFGNVPHDGDVCLRKDVDLGKLHQLKTARLEKSYAKAIAEYEKNKDWKWIDMMYGIKEGDTLADHVQKNAPVQEQDVTHAAFLRNLHWHEHERMGWWGGTVATECEMKANTESIETMIRRCKHKDKKTGASVVCWKEPWEVWSLEFWKRFVEPLAPEVTLVTVDYHV